MAQTEEPPTLAELDQELVDDVWYEAYARAERHGVDLGNPLSEYRMVADAMATWIAGDSDRAAEFMTWAERS